MAIYPKEDLKMTLDMTTGAKLVGNANIAGRTVAEYIKNNEKDVVLYNAESSDFEVGQTLFVSKNQVVCVEPSCEMIKLNTAKWAKIKIYTVNGQIITGEIDISGYDRTSDFLVNFSESFYEIFDCTVNDKNHGFLLVSVANTLWKEPLG